MTYRVRFVCTGNICRSPMAESVLHARVEEAGLAGTAEECLEMVEAASEGLLAAVRESVEERAV